MGLEKEIDFLTKKIQEIDNLKSEIRFSPDFKKWKTETGRFLERVFDKNSSHARDFKIISYYLWNCGPSAADSQHEEAYKKD